MQVEYAPLFLGIDGGGSKCRAVIVGADGAVLGSGLGGPASPFQGFEQSIASITAATHRALASAGLEEARARRLHACLGLAGVNLPAVHRQVLEWAHPFSDVLVATDSRVACIGAHGGADGAILIAGTGSCGYAMVDGEEVLVGGHGFPCGDKGGGAWTGLRALEHVLRTLDGLGEPTSLVARLLTHLGARDALGLVGRLGGHGAVEYARLAPLVFAAADEGDKVATAIVREGAEYLDGLARRLLAAAPPRMSLRMSLIGGLAPLVTRWLAPEVAAALSPALEAPEMGSVRLAVQHWHERAAGQATG
jgi:glucosamine kinase